MRTFPYEVALAQMTFKNITIMLKTAKILVSKTSADVKVTSPYYPTK